MHPEIAKCMDQLIAWPQAQKKCSSYENGCGLIDSVLDLKQKLNINTV